MCLIGSARVIRTPSAGYEPAVLPLDDLRNGASNWIRTSALPGMNRSLYR